GFVAPQRRGRNDERLVGLHSGDVEVADVVGDHVRLAAGCVRLLDLSRGVEAVEWRARYAHPVVAIFLVSRTIETSQAICITAQERHTVVVGILFAWLVLGGAATVESH